MTFPIQVKRGPAALWTEKNYRLRDGEIGYEDDTGKFKIGNGVKTWRELSYFIDESVITTLVASIIASNGGTDGDPRIGDITTLTTTSKTTVVSAINEVNTPPVSLTLLYDNAKAG